MFPEFDETPAGSGGRFAGDEVMRNALEVSLEIRA